MTRIRIPFALAILLAAGTARATPTTTWSQVWDGYNSVTTVQALTTGAPAEASEGVDLNGVSSLYITVSAPSGQTISGGTIQLYGYNGVIGRWFKLDPQQDWTLPTGQRDVASVRYDVNGTGTSRLCAIASGITLSGAGTTVQVGIFTTGKR